MLAMVILAVVTFYTKVMIQFEGQNQMEAFYAINGFTLLIVAGIIIIKIKGQGKQLVNHKIQEMDELK